MLCYVVPCIYLHSMVELRLRLRLRFLWGNFLGETQGGPGLQIDKDNRYSKAKVKYTKTKTKTKYRHRYTKKTSTLQTKTKTCSVPSSAKRTNLSGGLACLLWNPGRGEGYKGTDGVNGAIIEAGEPGRDPRSVHGKGNQEFFQFFPVFSTLLHSANLVGKHRG